MLHCKVVRETSVLDSEFKHHIGGDLKGSGVNITIPPYMPFVWVALALKEDFPSMPIKFPAVIDTGYNGHFFLRMEHFREVLPAEFYADKLLVASQSNSKSKLRYDKYGVFFPLDANLFVCDRDADARSYNTTHHHLVELSFNTNVYVSLEEAISHSEGKFRDKIQKFQYDRRPEVPLIGSRFFEQGKLMLHCAGNSFSIAKWSWLRQLGNPRAGQAHAS